MLPDVPQRRAVDSAAPVLQAHGGLELAERHPTSTAVRRRLRFGGGHERDGSVITLGAAISAGMCRTNIQAIFRARALILGVGLLLYKRAQVVPSDSTGTMEISGTIQPALLGPPPSYTGTIRGTGTIGNRVTS